MTKIASGWRLTRSSLASWRKHFKLFALVTAAIAVPANLIQLVAPSTDTSLSAYISLSAVVMNLALIWAIIQVEQGHKVKLRQAYYQGTASFVRFLLVSLLLILELIPAALGLLLYSVGVVGAAPGTTAFEKGFISLLVLLLASPSLLMINRSLLAMVVVPASELSPIAAIRQSWRSVKGQSWQVLRRFLSLILAAGILMSVPALVLVYLYQSTSNRGFLAILQVLISLLLLPFVNLYLYKLYRDLT